MGALIRYAWVLGLLGLLLVAVAAGWGWTVGSVEGWPTGLLVGGAVALILYAVFDRERVGETVSSRSFVYGSGSSLMIVMAAAVAVGLFLLAKRYDHTWDLTEARDFTLSDQAVRVASGLDEDVRVLAFYANESQPQQELRDLVRRLQEHTERLQVEYIDPVRQPRLAREYEVTGGEGTVVLEQGEQQRRIDGAVDEDELIRALVLLGSDVEHRICWAVGHGEADPDDEFAQDGLGNIVLELEGLNYRVTRQNVLTTGIDPACEALVVARPSTDWLPYEREALAAYLAGGGRAFVLLDPGVAPELADELARYGVRVGDDVVVDLNFENQMMGVDDPSSVVLSGRNLLPHAITRSLQAAVVLRIARSVSAMPDAVQGISVTEILRTSPDAWGETDPQDPDLRPDEGVEVVGEVPVMVVAEIDDPAAVDVVGAPSEAPGEAEVPASEPAEAEAPAEPGALTEAGTAEEAPAPSLDLQGDRARGVPQGFTPKAGGRLVVVGDSDFANNVLLVFGNNRDLFLNTIAWLVDEEEQIAERPREAETLEITGVGEALLCLVSVVVVPGAAVVFALMTLLRRRRL